MSDKGIIFSAPMVCALLDGRKTQTRRLLKLPAAPANLGEWQASTVGGPGVLDGKGNETPEYPCVWHTRTGATVVPPYAVGSRLYVRETVRAIERESGLDQFQYRATLDRENEDAETVPNEPDAGGWGDLSIYARGKKGRKNFATCEDDLTFAGPWVPAIHAPRATSRLWLSITDVRVQPLQEISVTDVRAEGVKLHEPRQFNMFGMNAEERAAHRLLCARIDWEDLWNSLHTADGERWQDNPWVVAVSFDVHRGNIDAEGKGA